MRRVDVTSGTGQRSQFWAGADDDAQAAREAFRSLAADFGAPAMLRAGTDLYGPYVEFAARRLSGREVATAKVRP